ncbi:MAG: UDP-N-acetylglucosamine 1-carboxyvinyltransferase [Cyanobacteria bacterium REEB459]|nr:UDP-N-acetylglucosamine 1-carboxyvinyltransferase [Cyanobacteria bacterium REEB459]
MEDTAIVTSIHLSNSPTTADTGDAILEVTGGSSLSGQVAISGAKNSALVVMAATLLTSQPCRLRNVPHLVDIDRMGEVLSALGLTLNRQDQALEIVSPTLTTTQAPYDLVSRLRASFFVIGPLLARTGMAQVPLPGGCAIGARPVELHVRGLQAMGANVHIDHGTVHAYIPGQTGRLRGTKIYLDYPSVGATETLMMAATLAQGETIIENAAQEPEVIDLANFCRAMGGRIRGAGTNTIRIVGTHELHGADYEIIPDRIEAGTFLVAAAITRSSLSLAPVVPEHLTAIVAKLQEIGGQVLLEGPNQVRYQPGSRILPATIQTGPFPGFPTDMQAQFMALLAHGDGTSLISETVFENRLRHVAELNRMGADIRLNGNSAIINGVPRLSAAPVMATDLRASAALVLAGLAAEGTTVIQGLHHLDRGYHNLEGKLQRLGAKITRHRA